MSSHIEDFEIKFFHFKRKVQVATAASSSNNKSSSVVDSGSEYGDINETDLTGEEFLEKIDVVALRVSPVMFLIFNLGYWGYYMLFGKE